MFFIDILSVDDKSRWVPLAILLEIFQKFQITTKSYRWYLQWNFGRYCRFPKEFPKVIFLKTISKSITNKIFKEISQKISAKAFPEELLK